MDMQLKKLLKPIALLTAIFALSTPVFADSGFVYNPSGGGGGGVTNPLADDMSLVFGTTAPADLVSQVAGQTVKNFTVAPTVGSPFILMNASDVGSNVFATDVSPFFDSPILWFSGSSPLVQDYGFLMGFDVQGPNTFAMFGVSGDFINGTPRNQDGISVFIQGGSSGTLGGVPGGVFVQGGSANDGVHSGSTVELQGGAAAGGQPNGAILLDDHVRLHAGATANPYLEFEHSGSIPVSNVGEGIIKFDSFANAFLESSNGSPYAPLGGGDLVSATLATASGAIASTVNNSSGVTFNVPISGVDAFNHDWRWSVAATTLADFQGTANGVGSLASSSIQLGGGVPTSFYINSGDQPTPAANNLDWVYTGGKGGHNNPAADAGRGSNFQAESGPGGDGLDNSHLPGAAGDIIFSGNQGGTGSSSFAGGRGGNVTAQSGPGGASGGAGVGDYGDVQLTSNLSSISMIGSNSTIVTTIGANESNAWQVRDSSIGNPGYLEVNTNTGTQSIYFGNAVDNPAYFFLGTGLVDMASALHVGGQFSVQGPTTTHGSVDMQLGPFLWTVEKVASLIIGSDNLQTNTFTIPDLGADSSATYAGIENDIGTGVLNHNLTGEIIGNNTQILVQQGLSTVNAVTGFGSVIAIANAGTISQANGYTSYLTDAGAGNIITFDNYLAKNPGNPTGGSVTGLHVEDLTSGSVNYGVVVDGASTLALWIKAGLSEFDSQVNIISSSISPLLMVQNNNATAAQAISVVNDNGHPWTIGSGGSAAGAFANGFVISSVFDAQARLFIQGGTGNVGIGTNTPGFLLEVDGTFQSGNASFPDNLSIGAIGVNSADITLFGVTAGQIGLAVPSSITSYSIVLPAAQGAANTALVNDGAGNLSWVSGGGFNGVLGNNLLKEGYIDSMPLVGTFNLNDFDMTFTNPGAPTTAAMNGLLVKESFGASWVSGGGDYVGVLSNLVNQMSGGLTASSQTGVKSSVQSAGLSTISLVRGYESVGSFTHAGNIVTEYDAYHVSNPNTGGSIPNLFGLKIDNLTSGTADTAIYIAGATTFAIDVEGGPSKWQGRMLESEGTASSANNLVLSSNSNTNVTGTVQVNLIDSTGWQAGAHTRIRFISAGDTVKNNQAPSGSNKAILVAGSTDYVSTANSEVDVYYDGTEWLLTPMYAP